MKRGSMGNKSKSYINIKRYSQSLKRLSDTASKAATDAIKYVTTLPDGYIESFDEIENHTVVTSDLSGVLLQVSDSEQTTESVQHRAQRAVAAMQQHVEDAMSKEVK